MPEVSHVHFLLVNLKQKSRKGRPATKCQLLSQPESLKQNKLQRWGSLAPYLLRYLVVCILETAVFERMPCLSNPQLNVRHLDCN